LDVLQHTIDVLTHVIVPESNDPIARGPKPCRPYRIFVSLFRMLATIQFDDELCRRAEKVHDVRTNWRLASKLESVDLLKAQVPPQQLLNISRTGAELPSNWRSHEGYPPP
jgi:hypothetical protein